ncbi:phosphotransferase family protein [Haloprofundus halobius]|uniref:phosphotransferase family protein n=1 Tax=Haloprofundus halobius TaxID=2876194 RepID=UPI001CCD602D|nr:phosphotransferase [Haloprofundus halobius]
MSDETTGWTETHDVLAALSQTFLGGTPTELRAVSNGNHKRTTLVAFADDGDDDENDGGDSAAEIPDAVVVQFASDADAFRTETELARTVGERTSIPVPALYDTGELGGRAYAVVERAAGGDLHERFAALDPEARRRVARAFGRYLAELHERFSFEGYGSVRFADVGKRRRNSDSLDRFDRFDRFRATGTDGWRRWFRAYAREGVDALPPTFDSLREELLGAFERARLPVRPPSTLYPWDLRPGNAVVDGGKLTAVLDWGDPLAAAPGLAVAKVEHLVADWYVADNDPLRRAFRAGYESVRPYPSVPRAYRLAAVVRSAVDSTGAVTRPRYPELTGDDAVGFHYERLREWVGDDS